MLIWVPDTCFQVLTLFHLNHAQHVGSLNAMASARQVQGQHLSAAQPGHGQVEVELSTFKRTGTPARSPPTSLLHGMEKRLIFGLLLT